MTDDLRCGDPAALAGFVYDESDLAEREAMVAHLATCARCTEEVVALRATRNHLAQWAPPPVELGFRVTGDGTLGVPVSVEPERAVVAREPARPWWSWTAMPAWAQAAAAVALFAFGAATAAVMNVEVRRDQAGLTVRTGWMHSGSAPGSGASPVPVVADATLREWIQREVQRVHTTAEGTSRTAESAQASARAPSAALPNDLLERVRVLVTESEQRQQRELALRITQLLRDVETQRVQDIQRIERTVGPMEGITTEEFQQQRKAINYLISVSQTK